MNTLHPIRHTYIKDVLFSQNLVMFLKLNRDLRTDLS